MRRLQDGPREAAMVTGHCQDFFVSIDMSLCPTFVPELDRTSLASIDIGRFFHELAVDLGKEGDR